MWGSHGTAITRSCCVSVSFRAAHSEIVAENVAHNGFRKALTEKKTGGARLLACSLRRTWIAPPQRGTRQIRFRNEGFGKHGVDQSFGNAFGGQFGAHALAAAAVALRGRGGLLCDARIVQIVELA